MRLRFDCNEGRLKGIAEELGSFEGCRAKVRDGHVTVELDVDDPRAFLAHLAQRNDWPRPAFLSYGEVSLQDLYSDLYGVEAC